MYPSQPEFLQHILDECNYILKVTAGKKSEDVLKDDTLKRALVRSIEIIGEAVKQLDDDFRLRFAHVEWKKIAGTRDMMIHHYFGIDYDMVWEIITEKIPELQHSITDIIEELKREQKGFKI